ncbi:MAG: hypothetical protein NC548_46885 [Lachnospiraceae bacterium]|nr:hypothetical protein [Lachnospiraceae bacterium]
MVMSILSLAILIIATILAAYSFELRNKLSTTKRQVEKTEQILRDTVSENVRLNLIEREHNHFSVKGNGTWEARIFSDGVLVGKFNKQGFTTVAARWYPYEQPKNQEDVDYKYNCAEELLEKLTEEV